MALNRATIRSSGATNFPSRWYLQPRAPNTHFSAAPTLIPLCEVTEAKHLIDPECRRDRANDNRVVKKLLSLFRLKPTTL